LYWIVFFSLKESTVLRHTLFFPEQSYSSKCVFSSLFLFYFLTTPTFVLLYAIDFLPKKCGG
jgi:hypothetical protein